MIRLLIIEPKRLHREAWQILFQVCPEVELLEAVAYWSEVQSDIASVDGIFTRCETLHTWTRLDLLAEKIQEAKIRVLSLGCTNSCYQEVPFEIQKVSETDSYKVMLQKLKGWDCGSVCYASGKFSQLTKKEQVVVHQLIHGISYKEIAEEMKVKSSTVQSYKERAMYKLGVHSLSDLTVHAAAAGLRFCPCKSNNYQI